MRYHLLAVPLVCLPITAAEAQAPSAALPNATVPGYGSYGVVPGPPTAPASAPRPASWPGGAMPGDASGDYAPAGVVEPDAGYPVPAAASYPTTSVSEYPATPANPYPTTPAPGYPATAALPYAVAPAPGYPVAPSQPYPVAPSQPYPVAPSQPYPAGPPPSPTQPVAYGPAYGGGVAPSAAGPAAASPAAPQPAGFEFYEGARKLAQVGSEVILAADVLAGLPQLIEANKDRMTEEKLREQIDAELQRRLGSAIETKLLWLDAKRTIPDEAYEALKRRVVEHFETKEVPHLIEQAKVETRAELDEMLRTMGSSLEKRKRDFLQMAVAREWLRQQAKGTTDVTLDQIRAYYESHAEDFDHPGRAKWEELMVRFSDHANKGEAYAKIAWMGNQVFAGQPLSEVAKAHSQGSTAAEGGQWDWTTQESLAVEAIDRAVFGLPVGQLSPIIESDRGYHIVRVTEREDAHRTPFGEAQAEIREKLKETGQNDQAEVFMARLKKEIPVWTVYDTPAGTSADASAASGNYPYR